MLQRLQSRISDLEIQLNDCERNNEINADMEKR
ncbi:hypothetical protein CEAHHEIO_00146 [Monkeypox virus]|uniref:A-type inclusion protein A25 n=1 Tax=Monkeypox virus TaxID=10244 RepID=A0A650BUA7_MONPV|nr:A-type inclusion protein A25 [Monkeypox virus]URK21201.1 A-type inclusion protein A25 [Monkeypox virus]URK21392.1 A-type inclusion protein A25 [Monkeypox virus]URZ86228.1 hypothetical protein CEAHHEIO_00146 [Monkeypox virus]USE04198.1 hypothetical protein MPXV_SI2022_S3_00145 [Monkeypox virus]